LQGADHRALAGLSAGARCGTLGPPRRLAGRRRPLARSQHCLKCLLVADLHYDLRKFDWVVDAASHVDVVVLAGDHLDAFSPVARPAQAIVVQSYLRRIRGRAPLLICSGNHDLDSRNGWGELITRWITLARAYDVPTDGDSHRIGDTLFTICPWHDGSGRRAEVARLLALDAARRPLRWVWVHHAPPAGSPTSWDGRRSFGDASLRSWIRKHQPDVVLSGHVHQSPFSRGGAWADQIGRTWVFNAGHQDGPLPSHVVVDTAGPGAWWISLTGAEVAPLSQAPRRPCAAATDLPPWLLAMGRAAARPPAESSRPAGA
jgi:predicted phosphodiesterase